MYDDHYQLINVMHAQNRGGLFTREYELPNQELLLLMRGGLESRKGGGILAGFHTVFSPCQ